MIKRVKELDSKALIASPEFRDYVTQFESELNRGISTLCVLSIINHHSEEGIYGYAILKDLLDQTNEMLVIEEGTLYPILRKLEDDDIITSKREKGGRRRKFYFMTPYGRKIYNHLEGFYSKLTEAISPLFDVKVNLDQKKFLYCPMCANKINLKDVDLRFCDVCGYNIEKELNERGIKNV